VAVLSARHIAERPIFVVGAPRSGTTLLRYMLCSHPRIYLPPESNFIPQLHRGSRASALSRDEAERILAQLCRYRPFWRDWPDAPLNPQEVLDGLDRLTPASIVAALFGRYANLHGAVRWGDKTPDNVTNLARVAELFPGAQIVHLIRDARDVVASSLDAYQGPRFFYMDAYYHARMWRERVRSGMQAGRALPAGRYREIRYEDLTADPQGQLRGLCRFLGESFDPRMVAPHVVACGQHHSHGIHARVRQPVTSARIGRSQTDLTPRDLRLVERIAGDLLDELGYPRTDHAPLPTRETLRAALLADKYRVCCGGRRLLRLAGMHHPTRLLDPLPRRRSSRLRPPGRLVAASPSERP
jgi:hypothetical protein